MCRFSFSKDLEKYKYDLEKWCKIAKMTLNSIFKFG